MRYLLDTGVLLRLLDRNDPLHPVVRASVRSLIDHELLTSTQNIAEFWNVCTRPADTRAGLGLSIPETKRRLRLLERFVIVLREPASAYGTWKTLVVPNSVRGKQVHDARLAALVKAYRIKRILTLNAPDFARYPGITPVIPQQMLPPAK